MNSTSFRHDEVFPVIARVIFGHAAKSTGYASHESIVTAFLEDEEGAALVDKAREKQTKDTDWAVASNMVAWFSARFPVLDYSILFAREQSGDHWSYRPKDLGDIVGADDVDIIAIEGKPQLVRHLRYERDRSLGVKVRKAYKDAGKPIACEACDLKPEDAFPGQVLDVLEVHHRKPLSDLKKVVKTTLSDLALLCPTCHRAIHRTVPLMSMETFRQLVLQLRAPPDTQGAAWPR